MAETISGSVSSTTSFLDTASVAGTTYTGKPGLTYSKSFASTDISSVYADIFTVTTTPTVIDVTSLTNAFGGAVSFATVKHVQVINSDAAVSLTVGGGTNPLFAALPTIVAGGCVNLTTSISVSGSVKNLTLTAASGSISVSVLIVGN
jgi:hypothetical protein